MRIAVTGGNGEMGRALVPFLIDQGHSVVSIDRALPPVSSRLPIGSIEHRIADVCNYGELVGSIRGCDALIHLAAHRSPLNNPDSVVYIDNTAASYNALSAAAILGIQRVCLASSINAIGGVFSRSPQYDYFPLDEEHPTYAEDAYSLSKWVLEQQADAFARRNEAMRIASLRFHWLVDSRERALQLTASFVGSAIRHLWAYTLLTDAARACLLSVTADFVGHEVFYIVAPRTATPESSIDLARNHYSDTPIRGELANNQGFFDCSKAERLLGWRHED